MKKFMLKTLAAGLFAVSMSCLGKEQNSNLKERSCLDESEFKAMAALINQNNLLNAGQKNNLENSLILSKCTTSTELTDRDEETVVKLRDQADRISRENLAQSIEYFQELFDSADDHLKLLHHGVNIGRTTARSLSKSIEKLSSEEVQNLQHIAHEAIDLIEANLKWISAATDFLAMRCPSPDNNPALKKAVDNARMAVLSYITRNPEVLVLAKNSPIVQSLLLNNHSSYEPVLDGDPFSGQ
jgi:hypothetical protein